MKTIATSNYKWAIGERENGTKGVTCSINDQVTFSLPIHKNITTVETLEQLSALNSRIVYYVSNGTHKKFPILAESLEESKFDDIALVSLDIDGILLEGEIHALAISHYMPKERTTFAGIFIRDKRAKDFNITLTVQKGTSVTTIVYDLAAGTSTVVSTKEVEGTGETKFIKILRASNENHTPRKPRTTTQNKKAEVKATGQLRPNTNVKRERTTFLKPNTNKRPE
jgi:hypothetical protein